MESVPASAAAAALAAANAALTAGADALGKATGYEGAGELVGSLLVPMAWRAYKGAGWLLASAPWAGMAALLGALWLLLGGLGHGQGAAHAPAAAAKVAEPLANLLKPGGPVTPNGVVPQLVWNIASALFAALGSGGGALGAPAAAAASAGWSTMAFRKPLSTALRYAGAKLMGVPTPGAGSMAGTLASMLAAGTSSVGASAFRSAGGLASIARHPLSYGTRAAVVALSVAAAERLTGFIPGMGALESLFVPLAAAGADWLVGPHIGAAVRAGHAMGGAGRRAKKQ